jgi:citrate lyase beta subunit
MLKTFFFVPTNNYRYIKNISRIASDNFIFDLEDSIIDDDLKICINNISKVSLKNNYYARPRIFFKKNEKYIKKLVLIGFKKFIIPKISSLQHLKNIKKTITAIKSYKDDHFEFIILIENPRCLLNIHKLIKSNILNVTGISLGSHDYADKMGMKHEAKYLSYARNKVLTIAKANNLLSVDIASMNYKDKKSFSDECVDAYNMGHDGKFILHPNQLDALKTANYFSKEEIEEAKSVLNQLKYMKENKFSLILVGEKLFEKSHLKRIKKIVEWHKNSLES